MGASVCVFIRSDAKFKFLFCFLQHTDEESDVDSLQTQPRGLSVLQRSVTVSILPLKGPDAKIRAPNSRSVLLTTPPSPPPPPLRARGSRSTRPRRACPAAAATTAPTRSSAGGPNTARPRRDTPMGAATAGDAATDRPSIPSASQQLELLLPGNQGTSDEISSNSQLLVFFSVTVECPRHLSALLSRFMAIFRTSSRYFLCQNSKSNHDLLCISSLISASQTFDPNLAACCIIETHYLKSQAWDRIGIFGKKKKKNSACFCSARVSGLGLTCTGLWVTNRVWEALSDPRCLSTNQDSPKCSTRKPSTNQKASLSRLYHH